MIKKFKKEYKTNGGAAMITLVFFFVFLSLAILLGITMPTIREFRIANANLNSKQSYFLSESGIEDAVYRMKNNMSIDETENLVLGSSSTITIITDMGGGQKKISSIGDTNSFQRKVDINLTTSTGVSFNYGVQVGTGGLNMNSSAVFGNIYSNGPITGNSSSFVVGTAISANSPSLIADQSNGAGTPLSDIIFAKTSNSQDIAQSFQVSQLSPLNKIQIYIKKVGNPGNTTVRIVGDDSGNPGNTTLAQGILYSNVVTNSYGWIDVSFNSNPILSLNTTYWLVIDANYSSSKYYIIGASADNYLNGIAKIGKFKNTWNDTTPINLDYYFNIYLGGLTGLIEGSSGSKWNPLYIGLIYGSAQAHTVNYTYTSGSIYCQNGTGNNKSCLSQTDPTYVSSPISDANITEWKNDALAGGTYQGNYSVGWSGATIGPKKIDGDLTVKSGGILNITGTLWVTGKITLNGGALIKLDSSYGSDDGVIVSDGKISISGGGIAYGSGSYGSYLMMLSTSINDEAIEVSGGGGAVIIAAPNGGVKIKGGSYLNEVTGKKIDISGGSGIIYESGLANNNFSSGPSGSWNINSWEEVK